MAFGGGGANYCKTTWKMKGEREISRGFSGIMENQMEKNMDDEVKIRFIQGCHNEQKAV